MPCDNKNTFLFWKWNTCLLFHSSPAIRLRFLVAILENKKNLSGNCQGTNLESLNNIYPRSFHSVSFTERKKLTHKNSPLLKLALPFWYWIQQGFRNAGIIPAGEGWYSTSFIRGGSAPSSNPLPFYKLFYTKKVPFSYTLNWQVVPLSFTKFIRTFHPF